MKKIKSMRKTKPEIIHGTCRRINRSRRREGPRVFVGAIHWNAVF